MTVTIVRGAGEKLLDLTGIADHLLTPDELRNKFPKLVFRAALRMTADEGCRRRLETTGAQRNLRRPASRYFVTTSHALPVWVRLVSRGAVFSNVVGARPVVSLKLVVTDNCALSGEYR